MGEARLAAPETRAPKVSILIPTYNQSAFLPKAIESALSQSYPVLEVIVGDDASSDETPEILSGIADSRLRYVRNPVNIGRVQNYRSLLLNHATGDFVVNLDGDDYFTDTHFVSEAIRCFNANRKTVMVVARVTTKSRRGEFLSKIPSIARLAGVDLLKKLPREAYLPMHMGVLYARRPALDIGFYRTEAISSDWESLFRLSLRGYVQYLNRNIGVWRIHGGNETERVDTDKLVQNLSIWESIFADAVSFGVRPLSAKLRCSRCVSYFAQMNFWRLSLVGNSELRTYLRAILRRHPLAFAMMICHPVYAARLTGAFFGYYRRKQPN